MSLARESPQTLLTQLAGILGNADSARTVSEEDSEAADEHFTTANLLWTLEGDAGNAIPELCACLAKNPRHVDALVDLGSVLGENGEVNPAIAALRKALTLSPGHAVAHFRLASALGRCRDFAGAVQEYQLVIDLEPNSNVAQMAGMNLQRVAHVAAQQLAQPTGLPPEAIASLGQFVVDGRESSSLTICSICIRDFGVGEEVRRLPCGHVFHVYCIDEWLRRVRECPLCKAVVSSCAQALELVD